MGCYRNSVSRTGALIVAGMTAVALLAGCTVGRAKPKAASPTGGSPSARVEATPSSPAATTVHRRRHRVGETDAERSAIIEPYNACLKGHGADTNLMPPNTEAAGRWVEEHRGAYDACADLAPQSPWGEDPANPEYRNNIHQWVQCMNARGLNVVETGDEEQPWTYRGNSRLSPQEQQNVELACEKEVMARFDR
jgi:hypothetical protein